MGLGFGTLSVAIATTPTVISTIFTHFFHPSPSTRPLESSSQPYPESSCPSPREQLSYKLGVNVVRRFLDHASKYSVEELQSFTADPLPVPYWVRRQVVTVSQTNIDEAERVLARHLSSFTTPSLSRQRSDHSQGSRDILDSIDRIEGIHAVGGEKWWRVRGCDLAGEWIEMSKDYKLRTAHANDVNHASSTGQTGVRDGSGAQVSGDRVILYLHGGAFFFSSLDTHRYQIQRHARKAGARAFAPCYRLAPQYPFPCGLLDALASYLYLLDPPPGSSDGPVLPSSIILMGDSAGASLALSLLVVIRDMGLPMPAGASLISPWVDLTYSMPSVIGHAGGDYVPSDGYHFKPSLVWPPLPGDGVTVTAPDGTEHVIEDQIQLYCPNNLLSHPLVSPINAGSLGGLCPLYFSAGGAEMLRDEIIYIAHKAAAPTLYPPSPRSLAQYPSQRQSIDRYEPTRVHLQVYDDCCHVVPTLSWTRSAKFMYRGITNFNIWAFNNNASVHHTKQSDVDGLPSADLSTVVDPGSGKSIAQAPSPVSGTIDSNTPWKAADVAHLTTSGRASSPNSSHTEEHIDMAGLTAHEGAQGESSARLVAPDSTTTYPTAVVQVLGVESRLESDSGIFAERVSLNGHTRPFEPIAQVPALSPELSEHIGQVGYKGAIAKWLVKQQEYNAKYGADLTRWRAVRENDRARAEQHGFITRDLQGERPPLCSLAGFWDQELARTAGRSVDRQSGKTGQPIALP